MGIGFTFIFYLIVLTIVVTPIALILGGQSWIRSDLTRTSRITKSYMTAYAWFVTWIISIGLVSSFEGRDIGFGDYWVRNISGELSVCAIDIPESMTICKGNAIIPGQRFAIQSDGILIQDGENKYCIDMNGNQIQCKQTQDTMMMTTPYDYYYEDTAYTSFRSAAIALITLLFVSALVWSKAWNKNIIEKVSSKWSELRRYSNY